MAPKRQRPEDTDASMAAPAATASRTDGAGAAEGTAAAGPVDVAMNGNGAGSNGDGAAAVAALPSASALLDAHAGQRDYAAQIFTNGAMLAQINGYMKGVIQQQLTGDDVIKHGYWGLWEWAKASLPFSNNAIILAAQRDVRNVVAFLVQEKGMSATSAMECACACGARRVVNWCMQHGNVQPDVGMLIGAAMSGHVGVLGDMLVVLDPTGNGALTAAGAQAAWKAVASRNPAKVQLPEEFKESLGMFSEAAMQAGSAECVRLLWKLGAPVTQLAAKGAIQSRNRDAISFVLSKASREDMASWELAKIAISCGDREVFETLLKQGCPLDEAVLEAAAKSGDSALLTRMLTDHRMQATPDAIAAAAGGGHKEALRILLNAGGAVSDEALAAAAQAGHIDIVRTLLRSSLRSEPAEEWMMRFAVRS